MGILDFSKLTSVEDARQISKIINQRPGRMAQLASLLHSSATTPRDHGDGTPVTTVEIGILVYISNNPGATNTQLAEQFGRSRGAISQLIKKLDEKGYVIREDSPTDSKCNYLYPTLKALKLIQKINEQEFNNENGILRRFLSLCSLEDIQTFYRMVDVYTAILIEQNKLNSTPSDTETE